MRIITISRQFGSGGRELGKRLSDVLGWDYYDKEIIEQLSAENGLNPDYVHSVLNKHEWRDMRLTYRNSFNTIIPEANMTTSLLIRQREIIEDIAKAGNDCIIVGRDADIILSEYKPFRLFVCADMAERIKRCLMHEEKNPIESRLSEKQIAKNIKKIDKSRSLVREMLTGKQWGDSTSFDLTVNAGGKDIKLLASAVADFALKWFGDK